MHYKKRGSAQLVHYQGMHVVSKVSKRFPRSFLCTHMHYKKRGSAQLVHYQGMHVVSKVSKRFPRSTWAWEIYWNSVPTCALDTGI